MAGGTTKTSDNIFEDNGIKVRLVVTEMGLEKNEELIKRLKQGHDDFKSWTKLDGILAGCAELLNTIEFRVKPKNPPQNNHLFIRHIPSDQFELRLSSSSSSFVFCPSHIHLCLPPPPPAPPPKPEAPCICFILWGEGRGIKSCM
ncbi:hypothetical protein niasHT_011621 [Heterodera trifolii]|uniref:Uncharacterized protein n=1 Tax=Heterodera trifolii TaxID=157864 RepID=A0ABD2LHU9_9BILA